MRGFGLLGLALVGGVALWSVAPFSGSDRGDGAVVHVVAGETLPDFAVYANVTVRKDSFFVYLAPFVVRENDRLLGIRRRLTHMRDLEHWGWKSDPADQVWLEQMVAEFRLAPRDTGDDSFWEALLDRVDAVPAPLVLVQAANESGWGTSRFAREGNNLFGQWCFSPGCGIVPALRPAGATHEAARFASVGESVSSYMRNLNTGHAYAELREIRARQRRRGRVPDVLELAAGLADYSERGADYVKDLRRMIRQNQEAIAAAAEPASGTGDI